MLSLLFFELYFLQHNTNVVAIPIVFSTRANPPPQNLQTAQLSMLCCKDSTWMSLLPKLHLNCSGGLVYTLGTVWSERKSLKDLLLRTQASRVGWLDFCTTSDSLFRIQVAGVSVGKFLFILLTFGVTSAGGDESCSTDVSAFFLFVFVVAVASFDCL